LATNLSVIEAETAIFQHAPRLPVVELGLRELSGAILAESVRMERDQPPFERVTMDGIAIRSDAAQHSREFRIAGTQAAGAPPLTLAAPSDCLEVMTGAELPNGCDCVIPIERLTIANGTACVHADLQLMPWLNVHRRGSDAAANSVMLQAGQRLGATEVAVIASAGYAKVAVRTTPRIAVISTGDELIEPGQPINSWQIRRSNSYGLLTALATHGFQRLSDAHLADDLASLRTRLGALLNEHDVLVLSGGVSMGRFDFIPQVLVELGVRQVFHRIAQRPGKPLWFGVRDDGKAVYALPGNPVSTLVCLHRYVIPGLLHAMSAQAKPNEYLTLVNAAKAHAELTSFMPVTLTCEAGVSRAAPKPTQGSGDFISLLGTDGFVELPAAESMIPAGAVVRLFRW
jgi:molybdopterin molybdotransferase